MPTPRSCDPTISTNRAYWVLVNPRPPVNDNIVCISKHFTFKHDEMLKMNLCVYLLSGQWNICKLSVWGIWTDKPFTHKDVKCKFNWPISLTYFQLQSNKFHFPKIMFGFLLCIQKFYTWTHMIMILPVTSSKEMIDTLSWLRNLPLSTGTWRPNAPNSFNPSMTWSSTFSRLSFFRGSFTSCKKNVSYRQTNIS